MEPIIAGLMVGTGKTDMEYCWIQLTDEAVDMGFTLVMVQTCIMVIIVVILTGGGIGDIYQMSAREMEKHGCQG